jgi:carboxymethylenebutenolidase
MKAMKKSYQQEIYPGAGHGFLRNQAAPGGANLEATKKGWPRTIAFLRQQLGS